MNVQVLKSFIDGWKRDILLMPRLKEKLQLDLLRHQMFYGEK